MKKLFGKPLVRSFAPLILFCAANLWWISLFRFLKTDVIGLGGDPFQTLWRFVRLNETLSAGKLVIAEEASLRNLSPIIWLPLSKLFGEVLAYNIVWLIAGTFAGYFTFLLARSWNARFWPAFVAGLMIMFSPYRLSEALGHFGAMQIWWLISLLLFLTLYWKTNKIWWLVVSSLVFCGLAWTDHQLFFVATLIVFVFLLFNLKQIIGLSKQRKLLISLATVLVLFVGSIPYFPLLKSSLTNNYFNLGNEQRDRYSADFGRLFSLSPFSVLRFSSASYGDDSSTVSDKVQTIGLLLTITIVILLAQKKGKNKVNYILLVLSIIGLILAVGPSLKVGKLLVPMPGAILYDLPFLNAVRTTGRFVVLPVIFIPLIFAINWRTTNRRMYYAVPLILLIEFIPAPNFPHMHVDKILAEKVAVELGPGNVLAIPAYSNYRFASEQLYYSTFYNKVTVGNSALARIIDPASLQIFLQTPVVKDLALLRTKDLQLNSFFGQALPDVASAAFATHEIGNIILETNPPGGIVSYQDDKPRILTSQEIGEVKNFLKTSLGFRETIITDTLSVFAVENNPKNAFGAVAIRGAGWQLMNREENNLMAKAKNGSTIFFFAKEAVVVELEMKIDSENIKRIGVRGNGTEEYFNVDRGMIKARFSVPAGKLYPYSIMLDVDEIIVENPRILYHSSI